MILYVVIQALVKAPGANLQSKFVGLGTLKGKTKNEIISVVGPPNSISAAANGKTLYQWIATGYHIALLFDGDACEGVTHQLKFSFTTGEAEQALAADRNQDVSHRQLAASAVASPAAEAQR